MKKFLAMSALIPVLLALLLAGCTLDDPDHPTGLTDVTNGVPYMALGNSLTAGFMDGGLIMSGQMSSFPLLIARQMGLDTSIGVGEFTQPYVFRPGIGTSTPTDPAHVAGVLHFNGTGLDVLGETPLASLTDLLPALTQPTPYENLGVPGAALVDVMNAYDAASSHGASLGRPNAFFNFINRAAFFGVPDSDNPMLQPTMLTAGIAKGARVATLWIGNNDVLGGATTGNPVQGENITPLDEFAAQYTATLMTLAGGLAQRNGVPSYIVVGNIGDITDLPYFLTKATFEAALGGSPWPWGYAEGNDDDGMLMTFPALRWVQDPSNQGAALPSHYTLTSTEVTTVGGIVDAYNAVINNTINMVNAQYPGTCALFDANALMADLDARHKTHFMLLLPQMENDVGAAAATTYFSLDGVHPNPKGYGLVANAVLEVINDLTDADYPMVDLNTLSWDPAYGHPLQKEANGPLLTPEAAIVLENMFQ